VAHLKRYLPWLLLVLALAFVLVTTGCTLIKQNGTTTTGGATSTTVTTSSGTDAASVANNAIQAVTKSASITAPQTLKAGTLQAGAYAPMEYPDGKGGYAGFDIDLCTAIAKKLGLTLETVPTAYSDLVSSLLADRFDMIMSALHITPDLQQRIAFSDAYLPGTLAITTPTGAPIADSAGLAGKRVGVQVNTNAQTVVEGIAGIKQVKDYNTILEAFQDLTSGKLDAVVSDVVVDAYIVQNIGDFKTKLADSGAISTQVGYGYGFKQPNTALATAVNAALQELRTDGVYQKICAKWSVTGN
jgi:polar amino acid transport system substrate-binding protein